MIALDLLRELPASCTTAILTDSKAALQAPAHRRRLLNLISTIHARHNSCNLSGFHVCFHWVPSHLGISGNEAADDLARAAHRRSIPLLKVASRYDSALLTVQRHLARQLPDPRIASGHRIPLLDALSFSRSHFVCLLRLRVGCVWTAEQKHRMQCAPDCLCFVWCGK